MAGARLKSSNTEEALKILKNAIDNYTREVKK